jgi:hypothetical protein
MIPRPRKLVLIDRLEKKLITKFAAQPFAKGEPRRWLMKIQVTSCWCGMSSWLERWWGEGGRDCSMEVMS